MRKHIVNYFLLPFVLLCARLKIISYLFILKLCKHLTYKTFDPVGYELADVCVVRSITGGAVQAEIWF